MRMNEALLKVPMSEAKLEGATAGVGGTEPMRNAGASLSGCLAWPSGQGLASMRGDGR